MKCFHFIAVWVFSGGLQDTPLHPKPTFWASSFNSILYCSSRVSIQEMNIFWLLQFMSQTWCFKRQNYWVLKLFPVVQRFRFVSSVSQDKLKWWLLSSPMCGQVVWEMGTGESSSACGPQVEPSCGMRHYAALLVVCYPPIRTSHWGMWRYTEKPLGREERGTVIHQLYKSQTICFF